MPMEMRREFLLLAPPNSFGSRQVGPSGPDADGFRQPGVSACGEARVVTSE
jgi:hypothetical protein